MAPASIAAWNTLMSVEAGASATLTGLTFVAVSINLDSIMTFPGLSGRAAESILQFLQVFLIATLALIPSQPDRILGSEFFAVGLLFWSVHVAAQIRYLMLKAGHPRYWIVLRATLSQLATVPFCVAGVALWLGSPGALYWLVPGFVFSFASGVISSWVLLVEVRR